MINLSLILMFQLSLALNPSQTKSNEFVFANENEPESIDPHFESGVPDNNIVTQLFEGLMVQGPDWVSLRPGQAAAIPKPTEGGRVYTFTLRKNLKWSDGSPLTAKDFEYSWLRAMDARTGGVYAYWLTDFIVGAAEYSKSPTPENAKKVGVKALDDLRFQVRLIEPVPYFLHLTAEAIMKPVKRANVEGDGDKWTRPGKLISNGAYRLKEWEVKERIVLEKNPFYWNAPSVKLEKVVALPLNDKNTVVNLFRQGRLDWTGPNGAPSTLIPAFKKDENFYVDPAFITYYYNLNTTRPPLNDKRVRQALALAIDRHTLTEKITRGGEVPAYSVVPPKTGDYSSPRGAVISENFQKDLTKAKALLAEAGFPGGKGMRTLVLQYDTKDLHKRVAQAVQEMWKKHLGVNITLLNQEWKVYLAQQRNLQFDISRAGWAGDYPDPATFLELWTSTSGNNYTGFKSAAYDNLFNASAKETNAQKRLQQLSQTEAILLEEFPIIPIYFYTNFSFIRPEMKGFVKNLINRPYIQYYSKK